MNRAAALAYLTEEYRELVTDAKFNSQQTTDAYNVAIDNALRYLGVVESDLATADVVQADIIKYMRLLDYFALQRFSKLLSIRFDVRLPGPMDAYRRQAFQQVQVMIQQLTAELAALGIIVGPGSTQVVTMGRVSYDFLGAPESEF